MLAEHKEKLVNLKLDHASDKGLMIQLKHTTGNKTRMFLPIRMHAVTQYFKDELSYYKCFDWSQIYASLCWHLILHDSL